MSCFLLSRRLLVCYANSSNIGIPCSFRILKGECQETMTDISASFSYRSDIYIDGHTYQISIQFPTGELLPSGTVPHNHSRYELHALAEGSAVLEFEDRPPVSLKSGDCYIIAPHIYHLRRVQQGADGCFVVFISCSRGSPLQLNDIRRMHCAPELVRILCALEDEFKNRRIGSDDTVQSLCTLLLVLILRELTAPIKQHMLPARASAQQREDLMDSYFAMHYGYEISAGDLAGRLGITTRQLARIMQQRYGCTFRQHLIEIRLYHARAYLTTTEMPVCRIATICGFASQSAFATVFRKYMGCSPTQYRREKKEDHCR